MSALNGSLPAALVTDGGAARHAEPITLDFSNQPWKEAMLIQVLVDMIREFRAQSAEEGLGEKGTPPQCAFGSLGQKPRRHKVLSL